jgi:hypothetical protein
MAVVLDTTETTGFNIDVGGVTTSVTMSATTPSSAANPTDAILAVIAFDNAGSSTAGYTPPGTWNEITLQATPTNPRPPIGVWWHAVGGSEPATQDVLVEELVGTLGTGLLYAGRVTGADLTTFLGSNVAVGGGASASPVAPSVTPTVSGGTLVTIVASNAGNTLTATDSNYPSGHTGVFNRPSSVSSSGTSVGVSFLQGTTNGVATGASTWTSTWTASQSYISVSFVIAPATAGDNYSLTLDSGSAVGEGANINLLFDAAYVLPLTVNFGVGEGQDIPFKLTTLGTIGEGVGEGSDIQLLFDNDFTLVLDSGSGVGQGQNITLNVGYSITLDYGQAVGEGSFINLILPFTTTGNGGGRRSRKRALKTLINYGR